MKIILKSSIGVVLIVVVIAACYIAYFRKVDGEEYKEEIIALASSRDVQILLENWVDKNVSKNTRLGNSASISYGGLSSFSVSLPFPWEALKWDPRIAQIQVIQNGETVEAIYFSSGRRTGLLVPVSGRTGRLAEYYRTHYGVAQFGAVTAICEHGSNRRDR